MKPGITLDFTPVQVVTLQTWFVWGPSTGQHINSLKKNKLFFL